MQLSEISEVLYVALQPWPHVKLGPDNLRMWFELFKEYSQNDFWTAIKHVIKSKDNGFPPTPGEVQAALSKLNPAEASGILDEGSAWGIVIEAVKKYGSYREELAIHALDEAYPGLGEAVRRLGYKSLCLSTPDDYTTLRVQLWRIYQPIVEQMRLLADASGERLEGTKKLLDAPELYISSSGTNRAGARIGAWAPTTEPQKQIAGPTEPVNKHYVLPPAKTAKERAIRASLAKVCGVTFVEASEEEVQ